MRYNGENYTSEMIREFMKQQEIVIMDQLSELISRDLLVVEVKPAILTQRQDDKGNYILEMNQPIRLRLKDQEYIEKLEKENAEYKDLITRLNVALERQLK